ncbi:MAG: DUF2442 domain-containing protein [Lentisphaerae bacterium]|nr:DUF2442 domain-containing protein [Lentisphaerota bacterium]
MCESVKEVTPLDGYELLLTFGNGEVRTFDMKPYLDHGVFAQLRDERVFRTVHVSFDTIEWENGADLCPEVLYSESVAVRKVAEERVPYGS